MAQIENRKRIAWIDIVRGMGIFLVIMGHTYRSNPVLNWIVSFHMPLFFILSGWLRGYKRKNLKWNAFLIKKIQAFLVPLVIFQSITYLYWLVIESRFRDFDFGPMWFLVALFIAELLAEIIIDFCGRMGIMISVLLSGTGLYFSACVIEAESVFVWLPRCMGALLFFLMGVLISEYIDLTDVEIKKQLLWLPILTGGGGSLLLSQINGRVDLYFLLFGNYFIYLVASLLGSVFMYGVAALIKNNRYLEYIGRYSIIILCTHEPIKRAVIQLISIVSGRSSDVLRNDILGGFIIAIIVLFIEIVVIYIVKMLAVGLRRTKLDWLVAFVK